MFSPDEFVECDLPLDLKGNDTAKEELGYGCVKVSISFNIVLVVGLIKNL